MMRIGMRVLLLVALTACGGRAVQSPRSAALVPALTEPVDWAQSAGIFIGVETFRGADGVPEDVRYAADDATDLAWLFAYELPSLLRADRTLLLLSGRPDKQRSKARLLALQREGARLVDHFDAGDVYAQVRDFARQVGENGVLVLFVATHGMTAGGAHVLLTPEATRTYVEGVHLDALLQAIPPGRGDRLLLFVDACREPFQPAPARMFEDLQFPGRYAIFAATGPGGFARPDASRGNGFFTAAVMDGLLYRAPAGADGFITPGTLAAYVGQDVRTRTRGAQRPEARFGGLEELPLFRRGPVSAVATLVEPLDGAHVDATGIVGIDVHGTDRYASVFVCAASTGRCWKQNAVPVHAPAGAITYVGVQYGGADRYRVHVALTADADFLRDANEFASVPHERRGDRVVFWLRPITVTLNEEEEES